MREIQLLRLPLKDKYGWREVNAVWFNQIDQDHRGKAILHDGVEIGDIISIDHPTDYPFAIIEPSIDIPFHFRNNDLGIHGINCIDGGHSIRFLQVKTGRNKGPKVFWEIWGWGNGDHWSISHCPIKLQDILYLNKHSISLSLYEYGERGC